MRQQHLKYLLLKKKKSKIFLTLGWLHFGKDNFLDIFFFLTDFIFDFIFSSCLPRLASVIVCPSECWEEGNFKLSRRDIIELICCNCRCCSCWILATISAWGSDGWIPVFVCVTGVSKMSNVTYQIDFLPQQPFVSSQLWKASSSIAPPIFVVKWNPKIKKRKEKEARKKERNK